MSKIDDIKSLQLGLLPDNTTQLISPKDVREAEALPLDNWKQISEEETGNVFNFSTYAKMAANDGMVDIVYKVSNDPTPSLNGYYHWTGSAYVKDASLANGVVESGDTDPVSGGTVSQFLKDYYNNQKIVNFIDGDNSVPYKLMRRIDGMEVKLPSDWDETNNSFYIKKIGLEDTGQPYNYSNNLPEIIISSDNLGGFDALRFKTFTSSHGDTKIVMYGEPIDAEAAGMSGKIVVDKALVWDIIKTNFYDAGASYVTPYKVNFGLFKKSGISEVAVDEKIEESNNFINPVSGDTSDIYSILRRIVSLNVVSNDSIYTGSSRLYISKAGLEDTGQPYELGVNEPIFKLAISDNSKSITLRKYYQVGDKLIFKSDETFTGGSKYEGWLTILQTEWDALKTTNYEVVTPSSSPYVFSGIIKLYNFEETLRDYIDSQLTGTTLFDASKFTLTILDSQIAPDSVFDTILKRITDWQILLTKDFGFDKANDYLFIRKMGRLDPSQPYALGTNEPYIWIAWYDVSEATFQDVGRLRYGGYALSDIGRNTTLYGIEKSRANIIEQNSSGLIGRVTAYKNDVWDTLKTETYEMTDIANVKFVVPDTSIIFEYEQKQRILDGFEAKNTNLSGIYNIPPNVIGSNKKFPKLFEHHIKRDKNINIILVGDSITARDFHTTYFDADEQTKRPPLMVSGNIGSAIYDKLTWQNAEYAKFDRSAFFTENGGFVTVVANNTIGGGTSQGISQGTGIGGDEWYDVGDRPADTRIYTGTVQASVQFVIPEDEYIFNFIYRTDLKGCLVNTVSIAEGNGKVQVYDLGTTSWVEANGYQFSMRHGGVEAHRINTKFQERLRFRMSDKYKGGVFDGRAGSKTITIQKDNSDSRFLYWGVEWSKEPYIVTVINAARGGENISSMLPALDDDVFDWINDTPDAFNFVLHEIYLNQGQNSYGSTKSIASFLSEWDDYFYSDSNSYSFREQSKIGGIPWQKFEALSWNPNPTAESDGILLTEPYGWHVWESAADGMKTILDNFLCYLYQYNDNYDEVGHAMVNITMALYNEAKTKFGFHWYQAFQASGVTGESFYNDVTHPNNYGVAVITRWLNAWFDFNNL